VTADKPKAGRTCPEWCGGPSVYHPHDGPLYCSRGCKISGKPLNPAPRPVESAVRFPPVGSTHWSVGIEPPKPRPVERCSCPEATRYKAALEAIKRALDSVRTNLEVRVEIRGIARSALALGENE
jgi:hypothetical protein